MRDIPRTAQRRRVNTYEPSVYENASYRAALDVVPLDAYLRSESARAEIGECETYRRRVNTSLRARSVSRNTSCLALLSTSNDTGYTKGRVPSE